MNANRGLEQKGYLWPEKLMQEQMKLDSIRENVAEQNPAKDGGHHWNTGRKWILDRLRAA
jgi:hypothetical protein